MPDLFPVSTAMMLGAININVGLLHIITASQDALQLQSSGTVLLWAVAEALSCSSTLSTGTSSLAHVHI
jgi:hypothetical protein